MSAHPDKLAAKMRITRSLAASEEDPRVLDGPSKSVELEHNGYLVQHELIVWVTELALAPVAPPALFDAVLAAVSEGLDAPYAAVVLPRCGDGELAVAAGVGWHEDVVGTLIGSPSALDRLLEQGCDVAGDELLTHARPLLAQHGCRDTCIGVVSVRGGARGLLSAHLSEDRQFSSHDVAFLRALAHLLGLALERREMLAELAVSETHLAMLLTQLPAIVWSVDTDLTLDFVAGSALERLTFGRERLVGVRLADVYARPGGERWLEAHHHVLGGEARTIVAPFDGRIWQAQLEPRRGTDGSTTGVLGMVVDVSDLAADRREAQERLDALERIDDERRRLLLDLTQVARDERHRLSREIHDDLGQLLTSAALYAKALRESTPAVADQVVRLEAILTESLRSLRRTVSSLREPERPPGDLGAAVERLAQAAAVPGVHVSVHAAVPDPLPGPIATTAYRIVQESLTNALKHADGTVVSIVLTQLGARLTVIVEDDGRGFDPSTERLAHQGHGLVSMQERAREIGGRLTVVSAPGAGTVVRLEVSVHQ